MEANPYLQKMMCTFGLLIVYLGYFSSVDTIRLRVVGGDLTIIDRYPHATVILYIDSVNPPLQICGGTILNERHVLTAAHCFNLFSRHVKPDEYLIRVGSSMAHSGGTTHNAERVTTHPGWNPVTVDNDVAIIRTASYITYGTTVQPAYIAGENYQLGDIEPVWAIGWGATSEHGKASEQLRHVQALTVNREICRDRYRGIFQITDNMLCVGWLGAGGRDQCQRDSGSPIHHHNVVVGIATMGVGCGSPRYPSINVQISRIVNMIQNMTKPGKLSHYPVKLMSSPINIYFKLDL